MTDESYARTDLACEAKIKDPPPMGGITAKEYTEDGITVSHMQVHSEEAAKRCGLDCGQYITLSHPKLWKLSDKIYHSFCHKLARYLREMAEAMTGRVPDAQFGVLIAGLGNREITPDAVGPLTTDKLEVTRHLRNHAPEAFDAMGRCSLSAIAPGVLGQTGIETVELIRGAVENAHPDLVIAVDALAARSCERLATTVQLSDRGISPGSGIGNFRQAICTDTVGAPVLALGVPTVVDSSTLVYDALAQARIGSISDELRQVLETGRSFFVSPKESDVITAQLSTLLAESISLAFTVSA